MNRETEKQLSVFHKTLDESEIYEHALSVMQFDMETICPEQAIEQEGETIAALSNKVFRLQRKQNFLKAMEYLYDRRDELCEQDALAVRLYYESYRKEKNITPALNHKFSRIFNKAFADWQKARAASDFSIFAPSLGNVIDAGRRIISLRDEKKDCPYDSLLDDYEKGRNNNENSIYKTIIFKNKYFNNKRYKVFNLSNNHKKSKKKIKHKNVLPFLSKSNENFTEYSNGNDSDFQTIESDDDLPF